MLCILLQRLKKCSSYQHKITNINLDVFKFSVSVVEAQMQSMVLQE